MVPKIKFRCASKAIKPHVDGRLFRFDFKGNAVARFRFIWVRSLGVDAHQYTVDDGHSDGLSSWERGGCLREKVFSKIISSVTATVIHLWRRCFAYLQQGPSPQGSTVPSVAQQ